MDSSIAVKQLPLSMMRPAGEVRPALLKEAEMDKKAFMKDSSSKLPTV